ncbi:IS630 family transposase [Proteiniphilum saccharofermentans]|uniref:IS630 family transposase n=1 Tax=Proteiniphilum saccharofermentans TaxID=1642647 RepID=UPI0028B0E56F|nr:IS630 family transposase [Proteiniphilum saccharofermentans]
MEKIDLRKLGEQEILGIRKSAMLLVNSGMSQREVCKRLGLRHNTLNDWCKRYNTDGTKGLHSAKRGARSEDRKLLSLKKERQVQKMITDKMPDQLKLDFALWTRKAVKELIEKEFGIIMSISTVGVYLRKWGFTPQKPKKQAYEQCSRKVQKWLDEEYPAIKDEAEKEGAEIFWGDETGVKNQCNHGRSYAPKGKTPVKRSMSKRFSVNMVSAVNNQGKVHFMIYCDTMNADRLIEFMKRLIESTSKKVYLILDNLRVHHSKIVKQWIEENKEKIALFYLPSYSPELNPDEYLNCDLKQGMSAKKSPRDKDSLQRNVQNHMDMLSANPQRVKKYFGHEAIKYAG